MWGTENGNEHFVHNFFFCIDDIAESESVSLALGQREIWAEENLISYTNCFMAWYADNANRTTRGGGDGANGIVVEHVDDFLIT